MGKTDDLAMVYDKILEENEISSYLAHHGIQGQKWGVRNGPPYPLGKSVSTGKRLKAKRGTAGGQANKMGALDEREKRKADKKKVKEIRKERRKIAKNASLLSDKELNDHIRRIKQENYLKKITRENEGKREMKPGTPVRDVLRNEGIRMSLQMLAKNGPKKISKLANFVKKKRTDMLLNNLYGENKIDKLPKKMKLKDLENDIKSFIQKQKTRIDGINEKAKRVASEADSLGKEYENEYSKTQLTKQEKDKIWTQLKKDFGDASKVDDVEFFNEIAEEYVTNAIDKKVAKKLQTKIKNFEKLNDSYWKEAESFNNSIMNRYGDVKIKRILGVFKDTKDAPTAINDLFTEALPHAKWISYVDRHFDDYWVNDTDSRYKSIDKNAKDFSYDNFKKRTR